MQNISSIWLHTKAFVRNPMPNISSIIIATGVAVLAFATSRVASAPAATLQQGSQKENAIQDEQLEEIQPGAITEHVEKKGGDQGEGENAQPPPWWWPPDDIWA
ncbi:hypothetical protein BDA99DRAFT_564652 [Phascolomyces articulosus]|uniref:Uncharacterized protein n=1 Tax=Phascolomyces articulosus TaxID=60185 RepID=A0AAD5K318_9FUNG|nr:hypothetical protein BDA99DRAFT_564652 [Phascolomyces articulosus]